MDTVAAHAATAARTITSMGFRMDGSLTPRASAGTPTPPGDQYRWQATVWPDAIALSSGSTCAHWGMANGQRGWKWQPLGGLIGDGTSPDRMISSRVTSGCAGSAAENSAFVYGWSGLVNSSLVLARSTTLPRYITATSWAM